MQDELKEAVAAVREAFSGGAPHVPQPLLTDAPLPEDTALVVRTSGSTGTPREVALPAAALRASAAATHDRLGGPGRWFLALPATHVAGLQVISRSVLAGTRVGGGMPTPFTPAGFATSAAGFLSDDDGSRSYVSLVPTQAHRLVEAAADGSPAGLNTLARFDAVLLGGAATPPSLLTRLHDAGVNAVTTYGMSETCGGCVYDGFPLKGVRVGITSEGDAPGVIEIAGPVLATGYLGDDDATRAAFRTDPDGTRWFRTSDLGAPDASGRLKILGRADDVIVTGGVNVAPAAVEAALADLGEACVVGVPDAEWGQAVVVVLVRNDAPSAQAARQPSSDRGPLRLRPASETLAEKARALAADALGRAAAPRHVYLAESLPLRGPGKPDRAALADAVLRVR